MAEILQKVSLHEKSICGKCSHRFVCLAIDNQPCFECNQFAKEVVRCKDCRHCSRDENIIGAYGYCYHFGCYAHEPMVEANDFCSYGERKDND